MTRAIALGALACGLAGCGTVWNLRTPDEARVYGGVQRAVSGIERASEDPETPPLTWPVMVADVPLSAIGDTVTLPVSLFYTITRAIGAYRVLSQPQPQPQPKRLTEEERRHLIEQMGVPEQLAPERIHGGII